MSESENLETNPGFADLLILSPLRPMEQYDIGVLIERITRFQFLIRMRKDLGMKESYITKKQYLR